MSLTLKTISSAILIVFVTCASQKASQVKPNRLYQRKCEMSFKGRVKSVQDFNLQHHPGDSGFIPFCWKEYYKFDRAGNMIENISYRANEKFSSRIVYRYDGAGNYIEWKYFSEDGSCKGKHNYEFDKDGNMIKEVQYGRADSVIEIQTHYYDEHGGMIEMCKEPENYHIANTYIYDSLYRPVEQKRIDVIKGMGRHHPFVQMITHKYRITFKYSGDTLERTVYEDNLKGYSTTVYGKNNKMLSWYGIGNYDGKSFASTYKYDAAGINIIEHKETKDGIVNDKSSYRCEYVYDKKGNWIKKTTTTLDGKTSCSVERKIEYY